ncbi:hypothetical protein N0V82_003771 [Gnomoniopsis sp. IMI 355080]|nr:hypothetical protein N0V82_003771 [Gnomoniopsis sp. IMI 355080]
MLGPTFQVLVNDTQPIFFYCAAPGSCLDHQMVGVINPNATFTYDIQLAYAENATYQMTPGEAFPSETASSTSASSTTGASSSTSTSSGSHLGGGAIAGITIGSAAVAVLAAALLYMCGRRGGMERAPDKQVHHNMYNGPPMQEAQYANGPIGPGPRSPGQETFATAYSAAPTSTLHAGQYGGTTRGMIPSGYPASTGSPPPLSEYSQSFYNAHGQQHPLVGGVEGSNAMQNGFFITPQVAFHDRQQQSIANYAVELPTSLDPGNLPLPGYSQEQKTYSLA